MRVETRRRNAPTGCTREVSCVNTSMSSQLAYLSFKQLLCSYARDSSVEPGFQPTLLAGQSKPIFQEQGCSTVAERPTPRGNSSSLSQTSTAASLSGFEGRALASEASVRPLDQIVSGTHGPSLHDRVILTGKSVVVAAGRCARVVVGQGFGFYRQHEKGRAAAVYGRGRTGWSSEQWCGLLLLALR
jgi:hypothetical protein